MSLLDEAASGFNASSGGKDLGSDDVIYGGNVSAWKKAVNAIKARAYLHKGDYNSALSNAKASFSSRADNFSFKFIFNTSSISIARLPNFNIYLILPIFKAGGLLLALINIKRKDFLFKN